MKNSRAWYFFLVIVFVNLSILDSQAQEQALTSTPVFIQPPTPEALAKLLFGPRYRSAKSQPTNNRFAMLIQFELDSTQVLPESLPLLNSVGEMLSLRNSSKEALVIEGHADARGTHQHNMDLSQRRAIAIKQYLIDRFGVPAARLITVGKGETQLRDANDGNNPINRRAEFRAIRAIVIN